MRTSNILGVLANNSQKVDLPSLTSPDQLTLNEAGSNTYSKLKDVIDALQQTTSLIQENRQNQQDYNNIEPVGNVELQSNTFNPILTPENLGLNNTSQYNMNNNMNNGVNNNVNSNTNNNNTYKNPNNVDISSSDGSVNFNKLTKYLKKIEGDKIAWLPTEKSATLPYGVYIHYNKNARPVKIAKQIFAKYGLNINNPSDVRKSNKILKPEDMQKIRVESAKFIYNKFTDKNLFKYLNNKEKLTYFNIALNSGKKTATRYLAEALGTSTKNIYNAVKNKNKDVSNFLIDRQLRHYNGIIAENPKKAVFRKGWYYRMAQLRKDKERLNLFA